MCCSDAWSIGLLPAIGLGITAGIVWENLSCQALYYAVIGCLEHAPGDGHRQAAHKLVEADHLLFCGSLHQLVIGRRELHARVLDFRPFCGWHNDHIECIMVKTVKQQTWRKSCPGPRKKPTPFMLRESVGRAKIR